MSTDIRTTPTARHAHEGATPMKALATAAALFVAALLAFGACAVALGGTSSNDALPQATATQPADDTNPGSTPDTPSASTCDRAREALLTGTKTDITKAMKALVADKNADATAREAAQDWLTETDTDLRSMHADLIQVSCTV